METIDPAAKIISGRTLKGDDFRLPYDRLLIATGASPVIPDLPGFDLSGVMGLKSLKDGRRVKRFIVDRNVRRVVIIGMGYIALEMCEAFRAREIEVDMVKQRSVFLPWMNQKLSSMVKEEIEANGVKMYPDHEVKRIKKVDRGPQGYMFRPGTRGSDGFGGRWGEPE